MLGGIGGQKFFRLGEIVKRAQGGDLQIHALAAQPARRILLLVRQCPLALALKERHEMFQFDLFPVGDFLPACPRNETIQQPSVSFLRVLRLAAFVAQVLQKIFDERVHCFVGLTVNSTNRLLCNASFKLKVLVSGGSINSRL